MKGIIKKSTGSWYQVFAENGEVIKCRIKGKFREDKIQTTNPIAVGDKVHFEMDKNEDTGIITKREPRKNYIIRKSINLSRQYHVTASNIDHAYIIVTLIEPKTSKGFIDRFLITAEAYSIPASIIFNKMDLYNQEQKENIKELVSLYSTIGYPCYCISALNPDDVVVSLKNKMKGQINLISGHSGVGKSTLLNSLDPLLKIRVGEISSTHKKGKHTTTFAEMHEMEDGCFVIDTPGIKELSVVDMKKEEVAHYFPEMKNLLGQCKYNNCIHLNEPGCAVIKAVEQNKIPLSRYMSYLSIISGEEVKSEFS